MATLPGSDADIFFGAVDAPLPDWRKEENQSESEDPEDDLTPEEEESITAILGFNPSELFAEEKQGPKPPQLKSLYSYKAQGRWVTMPANGEGGGGSPVYLNGEGEIEKGPSGTVGKKPDELPKKKPKKETTKKPKVPKVEKPKVNTPTVDKPTSDVIKYSVHTKFKPPKQIAQDAEKVIAQLSKSESANLKWYTGGGFRDINESMRQCPPNFDCIQGRLKDTIDSVEKAIAKASPLPDNTVVYRGMFFMSYDAQSSFLEGVKECKEAGRTFQMPSFTSTSLNPGTAGRFGSIIFHIKAKSGLYVESISDVKGLGEEEILQSSKCKYRIADIRETEFVDEERGLRNQRKTIYLEEITDEPSGKSIYGIKKAGTCEQGERSDLTGCTPASGNPAQLERTRDLPESMPSKPVDRTMDTAGKPSPKPTNKPKQSLPSSMGTIPPDEGMNLVTPEEWEERSDAWTEPSKEAPEDMTDGREETKDDLAHSTIKERKPLGGGVNATSIITTEDGKKGVWKPEDGEWKPTKPEHPPRLRNGILGKQWTREVASSAVAEVLGMPDIVPSTVKREVDGQVGSVQQFVDGTTAKKLVSPWDGKEDMMRAAVFDYLTGNSDRHKGNWMIGTDTGKLVLIDNGLSFPEEHYDEDFLNVQFLNRVCEKDLSLPDLSSWENKWPQVEKALKESGIEDKAIKLAKQRFSSLVIASKSGEGFASLPALGRRFDNLGEMMQESRERKKQAEEQNMREDAYVRQQEALARNERSPTRNVR